jgi:hypothetical protein
VNMDDAPPPPPEENPPAPPAAPNIHVVGVPPDDMGKFLIVLKFELL